MLVDEKKFTATRNACKLCAPLGASLVFSGIRGALPLLHGSQGCATYIRRYLISHFKEPVDIASSNFAEATAVFGGGENLMTALKNVNKQYKPELIGIATTCLSETIGDDVAGILREFKELHALEKFPPLVQVSTPSYSGTHMEGFQAAVKATVMQLAREGEKLPSLALFPGFVSPADMRHLKEIINDFGLPYVMLPDYSETLDGGLWSEYQRIQTGGTSVAEIASLGCASAALELGHSLGEKDTAGSYLEKRFAVKRYSLGLPVGVNLSDSFFKVLEKLSGAPTPLKYQQERGRLIDAYADAHKYVFEKKAVVYGEEDLVCALASFLLEIGVIPALCASGAKSGALSRGLTPLAAEYGQSISILEGADFAEILEAASALQPDFLIGNSKGYSLARKLEVPLVRIGFPIHDRIGAQRILHLGYRGAQELFDRIVNTLMERKQERSTVGYTYM